MINIDERCDFALFKSHVCHEVKRLGDLGFLIETLEKDMIHEYHEEERYAECLYLLAMVDYLSRINDIPLCNNYDSLRKMKMKKTIYPAGILLMAEIIDNGKSKEIIKEEAFKNAIPEFKRFNIVENDIRNVI